MNATARLDRYLHALRQRLRRRIAARAALGLTVTALLATLLVALLLQQLSLPTAGLWLARGLLVLALLTVLAALVWWPLRKLRLREGAAAFERQLPEQAGRIETYLELRQRVAQGEAAPFLPLLAEDAAGIADGSPLDERLPARQVWLPLAGSAAALGVLLGLLAVGSSVWHSGARAFWLGLPTAVTGGGDARRIEVQPGDSAVRRNQDVTLTARTLGFAAREAQLHVRYGVGESWEQSPMQPAANGSLGFTLYALREPAAYYVSAGGLRSREYNLRVVDPPRIEQLRLTFVYPAWTGLKPRTQEDGGDIQAVAGTRVRIELRTDTALVSPQLVIDEQGRPLAQQGLASRGEFTVSEPGQYRLSARFGAEVLALTDNFRIAVTPDEKPTVQIRRPGRDYQATSIEEVPVAVQAHDDFRLEALTLHFAVNGGAWQTEALEAGAPDINAAALLRLEELRQSTRAPLEPGDIVTYYAVARDHHQSVQTDLFLIQVQPFDHRYTQSQAAGGGGGGGGGEEDGKISARQREILMATFNLARDAQAGTQDSARVNDNATLLADLQNTLAEQARTLVERAAARALTGSDANVTRFIKQLEEATQAMKPAAERLTRLDLQSALSDEQRALQHLLRAEATFRDIQVASQSARQAGGGARGQAGRDVAEMTELELDLDKNQYETQAQLPAAAASQTEDESLRRLRDLARRQEQLARDQARKAATPEAQRWQQEQLRREAEALRQQLQQLAQQPSQGSQSPGQGQAQQGAAADALAQVNEAIRSMREGRAGAERSLNQARERLERGRQEAQGERFDSLARNASELLREQQRSEAALRAAVAGGRNLTFDRAGELAERKRALQEQLEQLQGQMQAARQKGAERAPDAASRVGAAARKLDEDGTAARLARSALEIDRGRSAPALARDGLITEALQGLQRELGEAARVAAAEGGQGGGEQAADPQELLAELGSLRQTLQPGAPGQARGGGQQGVGPERAQRLQALAQRLDRGGLAPADVRALQELADRLGRARGDPMGTEYPRMQGLVDQLELAALRAAAESAKPPAARAGLRADDPAGYRDNVAEYYRRLGRP